VDRVAVTEGICGGCAERWFTLTIEDTKSRKARTSVIAGAAAQANLSVVLAPPVKYQVACIRLFEVSSDVYLKSLIYLQSLIYCLSLKFGDFS